MSIKYNVCLLLTWAWFCYIRVRFMDMPNQWSQTCRYRNSCASTGARIHTHKHMRTQSSTHVHSHKHTRSLRSIIFHVKTWSLHREHQGAVTATLNKVSTGSLDTFFFELNSNSNKIHQIHLWKVTRRTIWSQLGLWNCLEQKLWFHLGKRKNDTYKTNVRWTWN